MTDVTNNDCHAGQRTGELLQEHLQATHCRTDSLMARLMLFQWLACIVIAVWISPKSWEGLSSSIHIHVWTAIFLGGVISIFPVILAKAMPGRWLTRHVVGIAQMLTSALLIHLTGGRIETHFHVFGSLALLAAYRDWRVLLTATVVVTLDHGIRGYLWPESVFGVLTAATWRTFEHAGWVIFENIFLIVIIRQSISEMRNIANQQARLESTNRSTEAKVQSRTAELRRAEERMRQIVENVPNGVLMVDNHGKIMLVNPKIEEMFGYTSQELLGQKTELLFPKSSIEMSNGLGQDSIAYRKDGEEFPVEFRLNPIQMDEGTCVLASVTDITERKRSENELKQYANQLETINSDLTRIQKELEQKNQELDEFTYVASHDLQEPVRKLISFSNLLQSDLGDDLNEQASRDLSFIVDAACRMRQLVQDLLALSRTGRAAMKSDEIPLEECCAAAIDSLQMRIEESQATVDISQLPLVVGDRTLLTQLFQNLIGNSLKFVSDGPPRIKITCETDEWKTTIGVKDNGIGMKSEHAARIFKPFQRLHRREQYEGTGIGLSICKKAVERHGGEIWVESSPGEGAHFKFTLPKNQENRLCTTSTETRPAELQSC